MLTRWRVGATRLKKQVDIHFGEAEMAYGKTIH
jgi:hypothetical protein